jgi:hypothetical protein
MVADNVTNSQTKRRERNSTRRFTNSHTQAYLRYRNCRISITDAGSNIEEVSMPAFRSPVD